MYCENPTFIVNRDLSNYLFPKKKYVIHVAHQDRTYYLGDKLPSPKAYNITMENYKDYNLVLSDGQCIPLFIPVPCGKCLLCRDKKSRDWATRATCETASAEFPPIFVTLTYEDEYLPKDGVQKRDVQLFMKRFRENYYRVYEKRLNLRYFAVGEYGTKYGRPHYHLLLWNIPHNPDCSKDMRDIITLIEYSWSVKISKKEFDKQKSYNKITLEKLYYGKMCRLYYRKIGRIDVSPDRGNSAAYCMKYMHKPAFCPPHYNEPSFYLSSRGNGGIGVPYLMSHLSEFRNAPSLTKFPVPVNGIVQEFGLPRVFKDRLWPPVSSAVSANTRRQLERFEDCYNYLVKVSQFYGLDTYYKVIKLRYDSIREIYGDVYSAVIRDKQAFCKEKLMPSFPRVCDACYPSTQSKVNEIAMSFTFLFKMLFNIDNYKSCISMKSLIPIKDKRKETMEKLLEKMPDIDVESERYEILRKTKKREIREIM